MFTSVLRTIKIRVTFQRHHSFDSSHIDLCPSGSDCKGGQVCSLAEVQLKRQLTTG